MKLLYLPSIEDEETLYGWSAYVHLLGGGISSERTAKCLYGHPHTVRQHELPIQLGVLAEHFSGIEALPHLLQRHTVLCSYWPFATRAASLHAVQTAAAGSQLWSRKLVSTSRSRPVWHPLRLCRQCVDDDCQRIGRSLWHTKHQLPGAWSCHKHATPLLHALAQRKRWLTPDMALASASPLPGDHLDAGLICAELGTAVAEMDTIDVPLLRDAVLTRLCDIGVLHSSYRASHQRIASWFKSGQTGRMCAMQGSGLQSLSDGTWIASQLWRHRRSHPARWVILWSALEWQDPQLATARFIDACEGYKADSSGQCNLTSVERARRKTPAKVAAAVSQANSYAEAMKLSGCSRADLTRWLGADDVLRTEWKARRKAAHLAEIIERFEGLRRSAGSQDSLAAYRSTINDRRWLREHRPDLAAQFGLATATQRSLL